MIPESRFDPAAPLPRRSEHSLLITGAGQAAPLSLVRSIALGSAGTAFVLLLPTSFWLLAAPLICLACFGAYGLAAKRIYQIELRREHRPALKIGLRFFRLTMLAIGFLAGSGFLIGFIAMLMERR